MSRLLRIKLLRKNIESNRELQLPKAKPVSKNCKG